MKKILLIPFIIVVLSLGGLSACTCSKSTGNQKVQKENFIFSIKGTDTLTLDRYELPFKSGKKPVMIFLFGGGFIGGNKANNDYIPYFEFLARNGFVAVSIDYRTTLKNIETSKLSSPEHFAEAFQNAVNAAVEDLYDATCFIISQKSEWNIDPEQIVISGSSAGAITVLQAEYYLCNGYEPAEKMPSDFNYAGLISFAGAVLEQNFPHWNKKPCPMMFFHGDADKNVPFAQAAIEDLGGLWGPATLVKSLDSIQSSYYFYKVENARHEIATLPLSRNQFEIMSFLSRQVLDKENLVVTADSRIPNDTVVKKDFIVQDYIEENFK